jgi:hypothetical protein
MLVVVGADVFGNPRRGIFLMSEVPCTRAGDAMVVVVGADFLAQQCLLGGYPGSSEV